MLPLSRQQQPLVAMKRCSRKCYVPGFWSRLTLTGGRQGRSGLPLQEGSIVGPAHPLVIHVWLRNGAWHGAGLCPFVFCCSTCRQNIHSAGAGSWKDLKLFVKTGLCWVHTTPICHGSLPFPKYSSHASLNISGCFLHNNELDPLYPLFAIRC